MKRSDAVYLYIEDWVRGHVVGSLYGWDSQQVVRYYNQIIPPQIPFEVWAASCGLVIDEAVQEAMAEANDHGLSQLRAAGIKVEPKVSDQAAAATGPGV